jgi:hypothetical protein
LSLANEREMKTITAAQMTWALRKGFAWADPGNASEDCHCLAEVYWTRQGGYMWDVDAQCYVLVLA